MLTRLPDWRARLAAEMDAIRATPFVWGSHDCLTGLMGRTVAAITGADVVAPWRGRYTTQTGALRVLRRDGFADLGELAATLLPALEHPSMARVGDVLAIPSEDAFGVGLGLCDGERAFMLGEAAGLMTIDRVHAVRAWQVG